MRGWTEATFQAALAKVGDRENEVLWLGAGVEPDGRDAISLKQGCDRFARAVTLFGLGCVASAALPGSALGPIGAAHASADIHLVEPPALAVAEPLPISIGQALDEDEEADLATSAGDAGRQEADVDEYLRFGSREVPRRIVRTIVRAASATGVDPVYLMALADTRIGLPTGGQGADFERGGPLPIRRSYLAGRWCARAAPSTASNDTPLPSRS